MKKLNRKNAGISQSRPVKVLQFGEGNFLRAFVDWMIDILNEETDFNGNVQIIQPLRQGLGNQLNSQEGLYHVLLQGMQHGKATKVSRLVTCVTDVITPHEDIKAFYRAAENPSLKFIVSNTTEAGIAFSSADNGFDLLPESFPGKLTTLLYHRFNFFKGEADKGVILLPCELIEKNGEKLKACIFQYVALWNLPTTFKEWIDANCIFCNTLVDRIVPGFPKDTIKEVQQELGYEDNLAIVAEPFHLWVIEGPDLVKQFLPTHKTKLNVTFTHDLTPYRSRKVRILNGAHTAMVPVAYLKGLRTVREAIEDASIGDFIRKVIFEEIIPTLDLPEDELNQFANDVIERFQNPYIRHELISISLNSISKFAVRVLPSMIVYYERRGILPQRLTYALAALIAFYKGEANGEVIPLNDAAENIAILQQAWVKQTLNEVIATAFTNDDFQLADISKLNGLVGAVEQELSLFQNLILQHDK